MVSAPNMAAMPHKSEKTVSPVVKPTNKSLNSDFFEIFLAMTSMVHIPCFFITPATQASNLLRVQRPQAAVFKALVMN